VLIRPNIYNHYVCFFSEDGKLLVMDYGTPYEELSGVRGPYSSIEEYKKFYEGNHPM